MFYKYIQGIQKNFKSFTCSKLWFLLSIVVLVYFRQKEESWMKLQVGDVLRIDSDDQIPVSCKI